MFGRINFDDLVKNLPNRQIKIPTKVSSYMVLHIQVAKLHVHCTTIVLPLNLLHQPFSSVLDIVSNVLGEDGLVQFTALQVLLIHNTTAQQTMVSLFIYCFSFIIHIAFQVIVLLYL